MAIDQRHMINIKGKLYAKYEGVLQEAHARGLRDLEVELIQAPTEENHRVAICKATAVMESPVEAGPVRRFTEYGDADPDNTAPMVRGALIRMAATRAKGRALRDAIGHGDALAEEMYDAGDAPAHQTARIAENTPVDIREGFCVECGIELTPAQKTFCKQKFGGRGLCPAHQK